MNPGRLREPATIQHRADPEANDDFDPSDEDEQWIDVYKVFCDPVEDGGREAVRAGKDQPDQRVRFRMRRRADIDENSRIIWRGGIYRVEGTRYVGRMRRFLDVFTVYSGERQDDG